MTPRESFQSFPRGSHEMGESFEPVTPALTDQTLTLMRNVTYFFHGHVTLSRDQGSFYHITCQGSILTLRHIEWFGISVQKYVDLIQLQLQGALSEKYQNSSV